MHDAGARIAVVAAYALAALLAWIAARRGEARVRRFWVASGALLLFLGVSKLFQFQDCVTGPLRDTIRAKGWYGAHREVQAVLVLVVAITCLGLGAFLVRFLRGAEASAQAAAVLVAALLAFVAVRAASIHAIDAWVTAYAMGIRKGWWIELAALSAFCVAAIRSGSRSEHVGGR